ncbi:hypothetical protein D3C71_1685820 [compost metagenome]
MEAVLRDDEADVASGLMHDRSERVNHCLRNACIPVLTLDHVPNLVDASDVHGEDVEFDFSTRGLRFDFCRGVEANVAQQAFDS